LRGHDKNTNFYAGQKEEEVESERKVEDRILNGAVKWSVRVS
jgi:hypothetical protein